MVIWVAEDRRSQRGPQLAQGHTVNQRAPREPLCKGGSFHIHLHPHRPRWAVRVSGIMIHILQRKNWTERFRESQGFAQSEASLSHLIFWSFRVRVLSFTHDR